MNLLITGAFKTTKEQLNKIEELGFDITLHEKQNEKVNNPNKYDIIICNNLFSTTHIDEFTNLKVIQTTSVGLDRLPIDEIKKRGIQIYNAGTTYSYPIAEWVVLKILEIYKNTQFFIDNQKRSLWRKDYNLRELKNKKVAILGYGNIGKEVAKRLKSFDTIIHGYDIYTERDFNFIDDLVDINQFVINVEKYDIIVICVPYIKEGTNNTHYYFDKNKLMKLKENATIINVSRGKIINEVDLIEVLKYRKDIYAALDVFEEEPLSKESELWNLGNVLITPHNSFVSDENQKRLFEVIYNNLKVYIEARK